jgi:2-polyprenyl-3-methyl-5-hydroxy-6-metoxy-1,4-benzoquinol methylase
MILASDHKHNFRESTIKDYEVCIECGSYHSTNQISPEIIYEDNDYWDIGDGKTGRSTLKDQISNLTCIDECGISKIDRIMQFVPDGETALEIAAAPGVMLKKLSEKFPVTIGIEPSEKYLNYIQSTSPKSQILHGYFPQVFNNQEHDLFDCIVGLDIFEHIEDGNEFIMATHRLLKEGGTAILMSPLIYEDGVMSSKNFIPAEHCWIYTKKYLDPYLKSIFSEVKFTQWILGHEIIVIKK